MATIWFYLALLVTGVFGVTNYTHQSTATIEEYPYIVGVKNWLMCTGVLVSPYYVLTSEVCLSDTDIRSTTNLRVHAGATFHFNHDNDEAHDQEIGVEDIILMSNQNFAHQHNVAVLVLSQAVLLGESKVQIAKLAQSGQGIAVGENVTVVSWDDYYRKNLKSTLEIVEPEKCFDAYRLPDSFKQNLICAASRLCETNGDRAKNGQVLIYNGTVYGFLSFGSYCPSLERPAVFTNLAGFNPEIIN